ncbi:hypothetical protein GDO78_016308 [Eleutherodactylus coqui]|uniref:Taste receptor type 2 n=1 Tax=Eleutherodactylus coqui TaxID=57060 RepID=A0A8J6BNP7_ELECQ|nr:hypothetical protein GDO78_016308 [Eleutherodactylus coqui]
MAVSTEGTTGALYLGLLVPALIALIAGLVIHSFIIGVNVTDWWKGRSVTPVDHIVTSLGISRMCAQCVGILYTFIDILSLSSLELNITLLIISVIYHFFTYVNFWLTSLLSIVFCLKISNFHTRLFLYLRGTMAHRTVYFIVAVVLLSAVNSLMLLTATTDVTESGTYNTTMQNLSMDCMISMHYVYSYTIGSLFPLLFYSISSVLLFTSLYQHTAKMKMSSNLSINLETYYSVMKFVSFTFIYNTLYIMGHFTCVFYYYFYCVILKWLYNLLDFLTVLNSSYLIYKTAKLRSQMFKILQNVTDILFQRNDSETRENIEIVAL